MFGRVLLMRMGCFQDFEYIGPRSQGRQKLLVVSVFRADISYRVWQLSEIPPTGFRTMLQPS